MDKSRQQQSIYLRNYSDCRFCLQFDWHERNLCMELDVTRMGGKVVKELEASAKFLLQKYGLNDYSRLA